MLYVGQQSALRDVWPAWLQREPHAMKRVKVQKTQSGKETLGTLPVLGFAQRTW